MYVLVVQKRICFLLGCSTSKGSQRELVGPFGFIKRNISHEIMFCFRRKKISSHAYRKESWYLQESMLKFFSKFPTSTPRLFTRESSPASQLSARKTKCTSGTKLGRNQLQYFQTGIILNGFQLAFNRT